MPRERGREMESKTKRGRKEYWSTVDVREDWGEFWNSEWQPRHVRGRWVRNKGKTIALCKCNRYREQTRALRQSYRIGPPDEFGFRINRILALLLGFYHDCIYRYRFAKVHTHVHTQRATIGYTFAYINLKVCVIIHDIQHIYNIYKAQTRVCMWDKNSSKDINKSGVEHDFL